MAIIQKYPHELDYVNAKRRDPGELKSFLSWFCGACLRADAENYEIVRPALLIFMDKYPARAELLERERRDRGASA